MKNKIFLFPLSLAVVLFASMIIIFSPLGSKTIINIPTPTPIPTDIPWQTYRNEKYNFEFLYPQNWEQVTDNFATSGIVAVKELGPILTTIADKSKESYCGPYICYSSISFYSPAKNLSKLSAKIWLENFYIKSKLIADKSYFDKLKIEEITVSGFTALKDENRIFIFNNNQVFIAELAIENGTNVDYLKETFSQILSTFIFLPDISTWKTYSNSLFSIKYPFDWSTIATGKDVVTIATQKNVDYIKKLQKIDGGTDIIEIFNIQMYTSINEPPIPHPDLNFRVTTENITINDTVAKKYNFIDTENGNITSEVVIPINNKFLTINLNNPQNLDIFNQILSTFKFTQ